MSCSRAQQSASQLTLPSLVESQCSGLICDVNIGNLFVNRSSLEFGDGSTTIPCDTKDGIIMEIKYCKYQSYMYTTAVYPFSILDRVRK